MSGKRSTKRRRGRRPRAATEDEPVQEEQPDTEIGVTDLDGESEPRRRRRQNNARSAVRGRSAAVTVAATSRRPNGNSRPRGNPRQRANQRPRSNPRPYNRVAARANARSHNLRRGQHRSSNMQSSLHIIQNYVDDCLRNNEEFQQRQAEVAELEQIVRSSQVEGILGRSLTSSRFRLHQYIQPNVEELPILQRTDQQPEEEQLTWKSE